MLLDGRGDVTGALGEFREAVRIDPEAAGARLKLGAELASTGDVKGGAPHLQRAARSSNPAIRQAALDLLKKVGQ